MHHIGIGSNQFLRAHDPQYQDNRVPGDIAPVQLHEGDPWEVHPITTISFAPVPH